MELTRKNIIAILIVGILLLGVALSVYLIRQQQVLKSRASADPIEIVVDNLNVVQKTDGTKAAISPKIKIKLTPQTLKLLGN